jgi:hypothetical protein
MLDQHLEQSELARRQRDRLPVSREGACSEIQRACAESEFVLDDRGRSRRARGRATA